MKLARIRAETILGVAKKNEHNIFSMTLEPGSLVLQWEQNSKEIKHILL